VAVGMQLWAGSGCGKYLLRPAHAQLRWRTDALAHRWLKWLIVVDTKRARFCWRKRRARVLTMAQRCSTPADRRGRTKVPSQLYRRRALVESVFSALKRKLLARARGRSLQTQRIQALLLLGLAYNLYRLRPCSS
jgi:Transposase DDE domain